ncbi:MAG TPA: lipocalin family protein [Flavobacterium sp.]|jgi:hypothetical protein|nr:lipocalin family protein [Flavobacterium sp.]
MKKVLVLLCAIAFLGCGSDDSNGSSINEQQIVGRWYHTYKTVNGGPAIEHQNNCETARDHWDILADHSILFNFYGFTCEMGNSFTGNWSLSGNNFAISSTFDPVAIDETLRVISLTANDLELERTVETSSGENIERLHFERD